MSTPFPLQGPTQNSAVRGLRILYLGTTQWRHMGARYYTVPPKLVSGLVRLGCDVLSACDRDIARAGSLLRTRSMGKKAVAHFMEETMAHFQPDVVLVGHVRTLQSQVVEELRKAYPHTPFVHINVDALFVPSNVEELKRKTAVYDHVFITSGPHVLRKLVGPTHAKLHFMPNPVDMAVETGRAFELKDPENDLFFSCGSCHPGDERYDIPTRIQNDLPDIRFTWHVAKEGKGLWGREYIQRLATSRAALNLSRKIERGPLAHPHMLAGYSSDRISHLLGNGVLTFSDAAFELDKLYGKDSLVTYESADDLIEKLRHYLAHDDELRKIAQNGWQTAHRHFASHLVAGYILSTVLGRDLGHKYCWQ